MKNCIAEGNSSIEWVDKETLRYTENGFSVLVWVDYEPGFFSRGRIIKSSSIVKWDEKPDNGSDLIEPWQKQKIIGEIQKYYDSQKVRCHIEE